MKKIFTCIFCAVLCVGSNWGTTIQIGTYNSSNYSINFPMVMESNSYGSLCQMLYLASEANISDDASRDITGVSFYFKGSTSNITRNIEVWLMLSTSTSITSNYFFGNSSSGNAGTKVFDGQITLPSGGGWYDIHFNVDGNTAFTWTKQTTSASPKTYNLVVTIFDKTATRLPGSTYHYTYTATTSRGCYKNGTSANLSNIAASKAYDVQHDSKGTTMPLIKFFFAGDSPEPPAPTPTLSPSTNSLDLGTFMQGEIVSNTFTLSASDLTNDVTLSATSGLSVSPSSFTKEQLATPQIVTVSSTSGFDFPDKPSVTIQSTGASDAKVSISAVAASYSPAYTIATLAIDDNIGKYYNYTGTATIVSVSSNTMVISQYSNSVTLDFSAVGGSYAANGTVTNIKGKLTSSHQFKALEAFTYNPPAMTGVTIKEDDDNSEILAEEAKNVNVTLSRAAFQKNMFNTFCVPFDISQTSVEIKFAGCDIITLASSAYNDGVISLTFEECGQMEAGQPYLINPNNKDISFTFNSCNIQNVASGSIETELVDFIGTINPINLPQSKEILFMGANNELFWPTEAGTLKGMRCYFKVNFEGTPEGSAIAGSPVRMSIIKSNGITTDLPIRWSEHNSPMIMYKNQLFIIKDNKLISISGQTIQ